MPTEQNNADGERIRERGREFGTTTGRPRRCGWFDGVAARYAVEVAGVSEIALTNLDVLSTFDTVRAAVAYRCGDQESAHFPLLGLADWRPVFREFAGWSEDITGCRDYQDLPAACRAYVESLEEILGVPIRLLSVGPERAQVIHR
jgi:adenylosuccinate synthase